MSIERVGRSMSFGEAIRLTTVLAGDPSSQVAAALGGWAHPISREDITLRELFDLLHQANTRRRSKPTPFPRPWDERPKHTGRGTSMTVAQFRALKAEITEGG